MNKINTERRITNDELLQLLEERLQGNAELQSRINELSDKLYDVNKKLQESEASKGHFISNITNEIINPFTSILALSENIQLLDENRFEVAKQQAKLINREAFHLDFQLKNIFAAAAIESGREMITASPFNLINLAHGISGYFQKQIDDRHIQLVLKEEGQLDQLTSFSSDKPKIELILKNLLSNAIKYSYVGGKIEILINNTAGGVILSVRDFGSGIAEKLRDQVYDRFRQADEGINSINTGHGLGLSVVKSFVLLLDGELHMDFPDDGGVLVSVKLKELASEDDLSDFIIDMGEKF